MENNKKRDSDVNLLDTKRIKIDVANGLELDDINSNDVPNDTEAALLYIKNVLLKKFDFAFPPVILLHQIYCIISDKAAVNKQIVSL